MGARLLSRRTGVPHIVDMRDGWLDEPLSPGYARQLSAAGEKVDWKRVSFATRKPFR